MNYVMSDIHGCFDEFEEMLKKINFSKKDTLYIIGDAVDRGPFNLDTLQYIMKHENIVMIEGNHERMMKKAIREKTMEINEFEYRLWAYNGGDYTEVEFELLKEEEKRKIYNFIKNLPVYKLIEVNGVKYLLIHGGTYRRIEVGIRKNKVDKDVVWMRPEGNELNKPDESIKNVCDYVIHGHTPTFIYGEEFAGKIIRLHNRIMIDCGCVFGCSLGCICLETGECFYAKSKQRKEI